MRTPKEMRPMDVADSAFAVNPDTFKSTSAYLRLIGTRSLVTWLVIQRTEHCSYIKDGS